MGQICIEGIRVFKGCIWKGVRVLGIGNEELIFIANVMRYRHILTSVNPIGVREGIKGIKNLEMKHQS